MKQIFLFLLFVLCTPGLSRTHNILVTGFWPPTNGVLRRFSTNPNQNLKGWLGKNFENSGYDIHSYFPEFTDSNQNIGVGDFRVDFAASYNDFFKYTSLLEPVVILSLGHGRGPWEIEGTDYPYFYDMFNSGNIPSGIGVTIQYPIPTTLKDNVIYSSSLPMDLIAEKVNSISHMPVRAWIDEKGGAGDFLCGFMAYLGGWYHRQHSNPQDRSYNAMAGFIHVEASLVDAESALIETLRAIIEKRP